MKPLIAVHRAASITATICVATFFFSTLAVEMLGSANNVKHLKSLIVFPGLFILIPAIAMAGSTGFMISKKRRGNLVERKRKRMPLIALNGLFILLPAAIALNSWAMSGNFDIKFYLVQAIELVAGAINLFLMVKSIVDGRRFTPKRKVLA